MSTKNENVKTTANLDERINAMLAANNLTGDETAYGCPVIKNRDFTITGVHHIKPEEGKERDDFKSLLFKTSVGFIVPVNVIREIENLPVTIEGNTTRDVCKAAIELKELGTQFRITRYTKAEGEFGTSKYSPASWTAELVG